jgi:hypothetical protein
MVWWAYLIVWFGSFGVVNGLISLVIDDNVFKKNFTNAEFSRIISMFILNAIFATLNCIFFAILLGLK